MCACLFEIVWIEWDGLLEFDFSKGQQKSRRTVWNVFYFKCMGRSSIYIYISIQQIAVEKAKSENGAIAVFGHGWGGELRLPQRAGTGSYFVDWVLARLDGAGELVEFTAIEVQTIDTTGNYREARNALMENRDIVADTVGLNWENVSKRIIPQLIYKGQVLQREDLCRTGLFFVCPKAVYDRVLNRLGGKERIPRFPTQPASIHFLAYDYLETTGEGTITPLGILEEHCTTVYKVQEAFSSMNLPEGNVYRDAIRRSLYGTDV